jgi:hypothetical protein
LSYDTLENFKFRQNIEMTKVEEMCYKEHKVTEQFVQEWMAKFPNDESIKMKLEKIANMEKTVFDQADPRIEHIKCRHPPKNDKGEEINAEAYIVIWRKQMAAFRNCLYMSLKKVPKAKSREEAME